jgi:hypothetical protein
MQCASCRHPVAPGDAFCGECGHPVTPAVEATSPKESRPGTGSSLKWIAGGAGAAGIVGIALAGQFLREPRLPQNGAEPRGVQPPSVGLAADKPPIKTDSEPITIEAIDEPADQQAVKDPGAAEADRDKAVQDVFDSLVRRGVPGAPANGIDVEIPTPPGGRAVTAGRPEPTPPAGAGPAGQDPDRGWFVVTASTPLRHDPAGDAEVIGMLPARLRVRVTGSVGDYLEVRSVLGGRNGYARRADLVFVEAER